MLRRILALLAMLGASFVVVVAVAPSANADGCDVDEETGEVVAVIQIGNEPQRVAAGADTVWVTVRAPESGREP